jgi:membrane peptidoglycan carboxypeptidase
MGITTKLEAVPGLILGQNEVTLIELTGAYSILANQGIRNRPHTINRILDSSDCQNFDDYHTCRVIYDSQKDAETNQPILSAEVAATMTSLLQGVVQSGTGRSAALGLGEAGKTGTTNDSVDLWFVGYIPGQALTTGIWFGNDDNSPTSGSSGDAAQLWGDYMRRIVR